MVIRSKKAQPPPPPPAGVGLPTIDGPRIIIRPDGSWGIPEHEACISPEDEEVLRRTTKDIVDINYIQHEDC